ncbi:MAG: hypothetical protein KGQ37_12855 [Hyphomicrobiales bacterium]|nr:hypothetical protein [Hyphomicrobiales bacterium]
MMLNVSATLFLLDAMIALAMGARYLATRDFMPYQAHATGRGVAELDPGLRAVVLAMLKVIGGGFLAFGVTALGLDALLWSGERLAGYALAVGAVAMLAPAYVAAAGINAQSPGANAPTRLALAAAALTTLAVVALLAS